MNVVFFFFCFVLFKILNKGAVLQKEPFSPLLTLWQRQTPQEKVEMVVPHLGTSLSPGHEGKTSQSRYRQHKDQATLSERRNETTAVLYRVNRAHLLQTRAQVAAEDKADPVYFHAMDAGLGIAFLHSLQVGFLFMRRSHLCQRLIIIFI